MWQEVLGKVKTMQFNWQLASVLATAYTGSLQCNVLCLKNCLNGTWTSMILFLSLLLGTLHTEHHCDLSPLTIQHSDESVTTFTRYNTMWFVVQCVGGYNLFKWGGDTWSIIGTCDLWKWKVSASKEEETTYWKWSVGGLVLKAVCTYIQVNGRDSFSEGGSQRKHFRLCCFGCLGGCNIQPATFY